MSTKYNLLESVNTGDEQAVEVCCSSRNKELLFVQLKETGADGCTPLLAAAREVDLQSSSRNTKHTLQLGNACVYFDSIYLLDLLSRVMRRY